MKFDKATLKARFDELVAQRDAIRAASAPLRASRDAIESEARAKTDKLDGQIRTIETDLVTVKEELSFIDAQIKRFA